MKFTPKTEKEIIEEGLLPVNTYDAEITAAAEETSAKGNDMIKLKLGVFDDEGTQRVIFDYLLESMPLKLRHAAEACGLVDEYESGSLSADDFVGKNVRVKVGIKKDKTGQYPDSNGIMDYIATHRDLRPASAILEGDGVPF